MTSPGIELLLRVVRAQLERARCRGCGAALSDSPMALVERRDEAVVVELTCRSCKEKVRLELRPESDAGVAGTR